MLLSPPPSPTVGGHHSAEPGGLVAALRRGRLQRWGGATLLPSEPPSRARTFDRRHIPGTMCTFRWALFRWSPTTPPLPGRATPASSAGFPRSRRSCPLPPLVGHRASPCLTFRSAVTPRAARPPPPAFSPSCHFHGTLLRRLTHLQRWAIAPWQSAVLAAPADPVARQDGTQDPPKDTVDHFGRFGLHSATVASRRPHRGLLFAFIVRAFVAQPTLVLGQPKCFLSPIF